jgi:hypothetical protein
MAAPERKAAHLTRQRAAVGHALVLIVGKTHRESTIVRTQDFPPCRNYFDFPRSNFRDADRSLDTAMGTRRFRSDDRVFLAACGGDDNATGIEEVRTGSSPFIAFVDVMTSDDPPVAAVSYRIEPMPNSVSRPVAVRYARAYLARAPRWARYEPPAGLRLRVRDAKRMQHELECQPIRFDAMTFN